MGWSYEDHRFEVTGCEPVEARSGQPVTVTIAGWNRSAHRGGDGWFARLVPIGVPVASEGARAAELAATPVVYAQGDDDGFRMQATFDLPDASRGSYQIVVGRADAGADGMHAQLVDAGDDGAFVVR